MAIIDAIAWELVIAAFAGGAFGAAVGALQSFSLAGLVIIIGEMYALVHRELGQVPPVDITSSIGFGVVLGPHIAFGGGAAAVAYAAKRGYLDTDFVYHEAKNVTRAFGGKPDVLIVGGLFGSIGYLIATTSITVGLPTDAVALGVVLSALVHRIVFGYHVIGRPAGGWLDMSPFERTRGEPVHNRPSVQPWLPYQYRWRDVTVLGVVVGILGGYIAYVTASPFLAFGICVVALAFLCAGVGSIPVTHHMSLPASTVVVAMADPTITLGGALLLGGLFGVIGALIGELSQRILYAHAETHLDPPAASIVITSFLIALLAMMGILPSSAWIPMP